MPNHPETVCCETTVLRPLVARSDLPFTVFPDRFVRASLYLHARPAALFALFVRCLVLAFLVVGFLGLTGQASDAQELDRDSALYAVEHWNSSCCDPDECETRESWSDMTYGWYHEIRSTEHHGSLAFNDSFQYYVDGSIKQDWFADEDRTTYGNDTSYIDKFDVAIVAFHGFIGNGNWRGWMRVENAANECWIEPAEMQLGDADLENIILSSCHSATKSTFDYWSSGFRWAFSGGLQEANGFHGLMWISLGYTDEYEDFASDGFDTNVASAWLDNLYDYRSGTNSMCPVAFSGGSTLFEGLGYLAGYDYTNWGSDPNGSTYWARTGIAGCNPDDAPAY